MLTGDIAERHVKKAMLVADRILPKPVDINLLLREIAIYWARVADVDFEQGAGIGDAIEYSGYKRC